jgi:tripartite-type tricarboxylate transporter receptor subunit TctC
MTRTVSRRAVLGGVASVVLFGTAPTRSQQNVDWPKGTVTIVVPFPPGGSTDTVVRILAQKLTSDLGQTFIVENRSGAVGTIGFALVARAKPDGYTLAVVPGGTFAMAPHLYKLPYDTERSFAGIGRIASMPMFLVVAASSPFKTVADIVEAAKRPGSNLNYAHGGVGSSIHLAAELFLKVAGIEIQGVPYRGMAPAIQGLLSGETQMAISPSSGLMSFLSAGNVRALAVTTKERSPLAPDVPTFAEQGFPGVEVIEEIAMFAPANTPAPIIQRLNQAVAAAFAASEVKERLASLAVLPEVTSPEDWPAYFKAEHARWGEVIKARGITVE